MTQRLVGINHVALEVEDVARSLAFYGQIFDLRLRGPASRDAAFIDIGDQFLALMRVDAASRDAARHVGLVVEDKAATRRLVEELGAEIFPGHRLDFLDPDGNRIEVVQYDQIQFTKADGVMRGMGLELTKTDKAVAELREKGIGG